MIRCGMKKEKGDLYKAKVDQLGSPAYETSWA